jgi:hypothetical protein
LIPKFCSAFIDLSLVRLLRHHKLLSFLPFFIKQLFDFLDFKVYSLNFELYRTLFLLLWFGVFDDFFLYDLQPLVDLFLRQPDLLLNFFNSDALIVQSLAFVLNGSSLGLFKLPQVLVLFDPDALHFFDGLTQHLAQLLGLV